jgi:hypothetical protein
MTKIEGWNQLGAFKSEVAMAAIKGDRALALTSAGI